MAFRKLEKANGNRRWNRYSANAWSGKSLKESGSDVTAVLGYRSELFLQDEFASSSSVYNATEDGNSGTKGTVIDAIKENNLDADIIFACGPKPMLRAIKELAAQKRFHVIFLLRSVWHVESELVLHVYVRQKMWMVIQMCITPESARTVLYLKQRRQSCEYEYDCRKNAPAFDTSVTIAGVTLKTQL